MQSKVSNHMKGTISGYVFLCFIALKGFLEFVHDVLLLLERDKLAMQVHIGAFLTLAISCSAAFVFSSDMAGLFAAEDKEDTRCVCYYSQNSLDSVLSIGTPVVLLVQVFSRFSTVLRAATFGDCFLLWSNRVPARVLRANEKCGSIARLDDPLLVSEVVGDVPLTDPASKVCNDADNETQSFLDGSVPLLPTCPVILQEMRSCRSHCGCRAMLFVPLMLFSMLGGFFQIFMSVYEAYTGWRSLRMVGGLATMMIGLCNLGCALLHGVLASSRLTQVGFAYFAVLWVPLFWLPMGSGVNAPVMARGLLLLSNRTSGQPHQITIDVVQSFDALHMHHFVTFLLYCAFFFVWYGLVMTRSRGVHRRPIFDSAGSESYELLETASHDCRNISREPK